MYLNRRVFVMEYFTSGVLFSYFTSKSRKQFDSSKLYMSKGHVTKYSPSCDLVGDVVPRHMYNMIMQSVVLWEHCSGSYNTEHNTETGLLD